MASEVEGREITVYAKSVSGGIDVYSTNELNTTN